MTDREAIMQYIEQHRAKAPLGCTYDCWCFGIEELLSQPEPPAGEFTADIRAELDAGAKFVCPQVARELCDRLDAAEGERDALKAVMKELEAEKAGLAERTEKTEEAMHYARVLALAAWNKEGNVPGSRCAKDVEYFEQALTEQAEGQ